MTIDVGLELLKWRAVLHAIEALAIGPYDHGTSSVLDIAIDAEEKLAQIVEHRERVEQVLAAMRGGSEGGA